MIRGADENNTAVDHRLLAEYKATIAEVAPDASIILYGSRARGDAQEDSDYDLLVLVDQQPDIQLEKAIVNQLVPLEIRTGGVLTVLLYSRSQWDSALYRAMPFHKNVTREGVLLRRQKNRPWFDIGRNGHRRHWMRPSSCSRVAIFTPTSTASTMPVSTLSRRCC